MSETIGQRIKLRLTALGMKQSKLAGLLNMTPPNISYYVNDHHAVPEKVLPKLAIALECSEQWLKNGTE